MSHTKHHDQERHLLLMSIANWLAVESIYKGGGPFGSVIPLSEEDLEGFKPKKDCYEFFRIIEGFPIVVGYNQVFEHQDCTCHGEVEAIRNYEKLLGKEPRGKVLFTSCQPCPMCLSYVNEVGITTLYYGSTKVMAEKAGFKDNALYTDLEGIQKGKAFRITLTSNTKFPIQPNYHYLLNEKEEIIAIAKASRLFHAFREFSKQTGCFEVPNSILITSKPIRLLDYFAAGWFKSKQIMGEMDLRNSPLDHTQVVPLKAPGHDEALNRWKVMDQKREYGTIG
jgi:tRNA(Arg) A34 adenosine deaminase TadA